MIRNFKIYFLGVICYLISNNTLAQHYSHFTFWSKAALQKEFSKSFVLQAEYHYRTQNDYHDATPNIFSKSYFTGGRLTFTYRHKTMSYSFAPFYIKSSVLAAKPADDLALNRTEFRPTLFIEKKLELKKLNLFLRAGYEYRMFFKNNDFTPSERIRTRVMCHYPIKTKSNLVLFNDAMFNVSPKSTSNFFNQNQLYGGYNYKLTPHIDLETGLIFNHRQRNNTSEFDEETGLTAAIRVKF